MIKKQVLIIMNNPEISQSLQACIESSSVEVDCAETLSQALKYVMKRLYCLLIIDLQMSCIDNKELIRIFRVTRHTPILALTEALESRDKIDLFHIGVDVFLEKPVDVDICAAQASALVELYLESDEELRKMMPITFGSSLMVAPHYRQVLANGEPLALTKKEFDLLYFFTKHPGQVFSRDQIYEHVWDSYYELNADGTVKVHIKTLRKKLSVLGGVMIENIRGVGYRFIPPK